MTDGDLFEVRIIGMPLEEQMLAAQHFDELVREFAYLRAEDDSVPARLLALRDEVSARFQSFTEGANTLRDAAAARGDTAVDLTFELPRAAAIAARDLGALLDEADEFCRAGDHLLTLATPERGVRFRRWYLGEFVRQADGHAPTPWAG